MAFAEGDVAIRNSVNNLALPYLQIPESEAV